MSRLIRYWDNPTAHPESMMRGFLVDIAEKALSYRGHSLQPVYANKNRTIKELNRQSIDVVFKVNFESPRLYLSTDWFYKFNNVIITRRNELHYFKTLDDLGSLNMVAWEGASKRFGDSFQKWTNNNAGYTEIKNQEKQVLLLVKKRTDSLLMDTKIFQWNLKQLDALGNDQKDYNIHDIIGKPSRYKAGFVSADIRDDFDAGLSWLKKNRTISTNSRSIPEINYV